MTVLRTPDDAFRDLSDWPHEPRYSEVDGGALGRLRIAHVEAGPADGPPVLLMHGEPTWSYLYRRMIAPLSRAGARVLAPDLVGFGRSDKPAAVEDYSYARHVDWMTQWLVGQDLTGITLFCQDWGGLIGLRLVAAMPERFARVCVSNSFLPTGNPPPGEAFFRWRAYSQKVPVFDCGAIVGGATVRPVSDAVRAAYNAPFPDDSYKAGPRAFPLLVPDSPDAPGAADNVAAWEVLRGFDRPVLTLFGDSDPVTRGGDRVLQALIPGAKGQPHRTIERAGHFSQEDAGEELAGDLIAWMRLA